MSDSLQTLQLLHKTLL